jgi:hypothetical protein
MVLACTIRGDDYCYHIVITIGSLSNRGEIRGEIDKIDLKLFLR